VGRTTRLAVLLILGPLAAEAADLVLARAVAQITARNFQEACLTLRPMAAQSPRVPDFWNLLGICESELHRSGAAREAFERGLQLAPDSIALHENLGLLLFNENEFSEAKRDLAKAVALGSTQPGVAFSLAASEVRTGEPARGLARLRKLEEPLGGQAAYWTERGWVELAGDPAAASASFDHALALSADDARALNGAASAAEARHEDEKALSLLLRARKAQPADVRILMHFGALCLRNDLGVDALSALEEARKLAPSNNLALFLYARAQIAFQQWQEAHDLFAEFDRRVPNYPPAQYALGWLDVKLNRSAEARQHLEKTLALDAKQVEARCDLAQLDLEEDRLADAESLFSTVLKAQPRHARANIGMGDVLLRKGDLPGAKARYEAAIASDGNSGPAHYKLSTVLLRLHENERAAEERARGTELNAQALKAAKTVLVLAEPDGRLLTGADSWR
jgi:tetratricopeptide (TPR) repeat protein